MYLTTNIFFNYNFVILKFVIVNKLISNYYISVYQRRNLFCDPTDGVESLGSLFWVLHSQIFQEAVFYSNATTNYVWVEEIMTVDVQWCQLHSEMSFFACEPEYNIIIYTSIGIRYLEYSNKLNHFLN